MEVHMDGVPGRRQREQVLDDLKGVRRNIG